MYLATIFFLCLASFINLASLSGESLRDISDDSLGLSDESIEFQDMSNEEEDMDSDQLSIELSSNKLQNDFQIGMVICIKKVFKQKCVPN